MSNSILVAGRNGQLAQCLRDTATAWTVPLVTVGRPELDFESAGSVERLVDRLKPSAIINAAAYTAVDRAEAEQERAFKVNSDGAMRLAVAAARRGIPFIHTSTDYVFDGSKPHAYLEDDLPAPINVYGASKLSSEIDVLRACPWAVIIRTSWVYSPYGANFVRTMVRLAQTQPVVNVVDDQRGRPTSAADLSEAMLVIAMRSMSENGFDNAGIYHLAGGGEATWYEFASAIFASVARTGRRVAKLNPTTTANYPTPARRPMNSCLDSSKAERVFNLRLPPWRRSLEDCMARLDEMKEMVA
ncbi:dTDP-4-dehydrorhamnose reductase [Bradyrhizobium genosp. L]|uniref:dTDP-4-dehydrorhamnose reductase n=1 Tax=Bradyrhizobium genosp. L TaxID=83637 RepID=UPI0018A2ABDD|nr:dTDP-4-dehydrorhamnose reductase [Bradyrhizobium genosp. L]QPF86535.1 dTDP-4-dehydrorhamnose reductase [Bradyrhizobium genosp. L]